MLPAAIANSISASRQQPLGSAQVAVDDGRLLPSDSKVFSALPFLPRSSPQGTPANHSVVPGWALQGVTLPPCSTTAAKFQNGDLIGVLHTPMSDASMSRVLSLFDRAKLFDKTYRTPKEWEAALGGLRATLSAGDRALLDLEASDWTKPLDLHVAAVAAVAAQPAVRRGRGVRARAAAPAQPAVPAYDVPDELEFLSLITRICDIKIPEASRGGEPFEHTLQAWLQLVFIPTYKRILKDARFTIGPRV